MNHDLLRLQKSNASARKQHMMHSQSDDVSSPSSSTSSHPLNIIPQYKPLYASRMLPSSGKDNTSSKENDGRSVPTSNNTNMLDVTSCLQQEEELREATTSVKALLAAAQGNVKSKSETTTTHLKTYSTTYVHKVPSAFTLPTLVNEFAQKHCNGDSSQVLSQIATRKEQQHTIIPLQRLESTLEAIVAETKVSRLSQLREEIYAVDELPWGPGAMGLSSQLVNMNTFVQYDALTYVREKLAQTDEQLNALEAQLGKLKEVRDKALEEKKLDVVSESTEDMLRTYNTLLSVKRTRLDDVGIDDKSKNYFEESYVRWQEKLEGVLRGAMGRHSSLRGYATRGYDYAKSRLEIEIQSDQEYQETFRGSVASMTQHLQENEVKQQRIFEEALRVVSGLDPLIEERNKIVKVLMKTVSTESIRHAECLNVQSLCQTYMHEMNALSKYIEECSAIAQAIQIAKGKTERCYAGKDPKLGLDTLFVREQRSFLDSFALYSKEYGEHITRLELRLGGVGKQLRAVASQLKTAQDTFDPDIAKYDNDVKRLTKSEESLRCKVEFFKGHMQIHVATFALVEEDLTDRGESFENSVLKTAEHVAQKRQTNVDKGKQYVSKAQSDVLSLSVNVEKLQKSVGDVRADSPASRPTSASVVRSPATPTAVTTTTPQRRVPSAERNRPKINAEELVVV